jgi:hypothetical protein
MLRSKSAQILVDKTTILLSHDFVGEEFRQGLYEQLFLWQQRPLSGIQLAGELVWRSKAASFTFTQLDTGFGFVWFLSRTG